MTTQPEMIRESQTEKLTDILNSIIAAGASFQVAEDEFQVVNAERLRQPAIDFLKINRREVLCTLQQSLLMKYLFSHSDHSVEDFSAEVYERESILIESGKVLIEAHFDAVRVVTRHWFERLLRGL